MLKPFNLETIFSTSKPVIGMVHLKPLPGSPGYRSNSGMKAIIDTALEDAERLLEGGVDGLQIENQGDWPFLKPDDIGAETVAAVTSAVTHLKHCCGLPMGINIHLNGVCQALAVAAATECQWVRAFELANAYVSSSGIIEAAGPRALRYRRFLESENNIAIFGDFHVKHGSHQLVVEKSLTEQAHDVVAALADGIIITGTETGRPPLYEEIVAIRKAVSVPLMIGSGLTLQNVEKIVPLVDGAIVGSYFKADGVLSNSVDVLRVKSFMQVVRAVRETC